ncbi:Diacylglycerol binding protein [Schizosaccharomyces pombe]
MESIADHFFLAGLSNGFVSVSNSQFRADRLDEDAISVSSSIIQNNTRKSPLKRVSITSESSFYKENTFAHHNTTGSNSVSPKKPFLDYHHSTSNTPTKKKKDSFDHASVTSLHRRSLSSNTSTPRKYHSRKPYSEPSVIDKEHLQNRVSIGTTHTQNDLYQSYVAYPDALPLFTATHPFERRYPPSLLHQFPSSKDIKNETPTIDRCDFPNYVPMFAFPNDITIKESDVRPVSTYHSFALTSDNNSHLYGICVVVWVAMPQSMQNDLEKECEVWRANNTTVEDREVAEKLLSSLETERSKLSSLLLKMQEKELEGSDSIDPILLEKIDVCEENIILYTELLRPMRYKLPRFVHGLTNNRTLWIPNAYGLLSKHSHLQSFCRDWLRIVCSSIQAEDLDFIPSSDLNSLKSLNLQSFVKNICCDVPLPPKGLLQLQVNVGPLNLYAFRSPVNEIPGWNDVDLYPLFRALSIPNILVLFEAALMEAKVIFLSENLGMLGYASQALLHLLYPLTWQGLYIPVLPRRLISCFEAPCSYIIGTLSYFFHMDDVPLDNIPLVVCDLDKNSVSTFGKIVRLSRSLRSKLQAHLKLAAPLHDKFYVPHSPPKYTMETYPNNVLSLSTVTCFPLREKFSIPALLSFRSSNFSKRPYVLSPILNGFLKLQDNPSSIYFAKQTDSRQSSASKLLYARLQAPEHARNFSSPPFTRPASPSSSKFRFSSSSFQSTIRRNSLTSPYSVPELRSSESNQNKAGSINTGSAVNLVSSKPGEQKVHIMYKEGHKLRRIYKMFPADSAGSICAVSGYALGDVHVQCDNCGLRVNLDFIKHISMPCVPACFNSQQILVTFLKFFIKILGSYRNYLRKPHMSRENFGISKGSGGLIGSFDFNKFTRQASKVHGSWISSLCSSQAFAEFIGDRCELDLNDPRVALFDQLLLCERNHGKPRLFGKATPFLRDKSLEIQRIEVAPIPASLKNDNALH